MNAAKGKCGDRYYRGVEKPYSLSGCPFYLRQNWYRYERVVRYHEHFTFINDDKRGWRIAQLYYFDGLRKGVFSNKELAQSRLGRCNSELGESWKL